MSRPTSFVACRLLSLPGTYLKDGETPSPDRSKPSGATTAGRSLGLRRGGDPSRRRSESGYFGLSVRRGRWWRAGFDQRGVTRRIYSSQVFRKPSVRRTRNSSARPTRSVRPPNRPQRQLGRLPPVQDHLDHVRRKVREPQDARQIWQRDLLGGGQLGQVRVSPALEHPLPPERPRQRLDHARCRPAAAAPTARRPASPPSSARRASGTSSGCGS